MPHPLLHQEIGFCADLDRGAQFRVENIEEAVSEKEVTITLKYLRGRWSPDDRTKPITLRVPADFNQEDIHCAWFGIPNFNRAVA